MCSRAKSIAGIPAEELKPSCPNETMRVKFSVASSVKHNGRADRIATIFITSIAAEIAAGLLSNAISRNPRHSDVSALACDVTTV